ncbi:MAG: tetratricopeptide repeat protein [Bacteroidetes bacterium]|nr:tetratricopeptide repeat protein [Bacteroidota bacterium]
MENNLPMRGLFTFIAFQTLTSSLLFSQNHVLDSLQHRIQVASSDSARWDAMFDLSQYYGKNNIDSAIVIAMQSLDFAQEKLPDHIARSLNNMGLQYMNKGEFDKATGYYFEALEAGEKEKCKVCIATTLGNVGIIFWKKKEHDKAEAYFLKAIEELETVKDSQAIVRNLNNLGLIYTETQKLDKAEKVYNEAVSLLDQMNSNNGLGMIFSNMGNIRYQRGKYEEALEFYQKCISASEKTGENQSRFLGILNAGWANLAMEEYQLAITFFDRAERVAIETKNDEQRHNAYGSKADGYKAMGDFRQAFNYLEKYTLLKDTLNARLSHQQIAEMETKYQTQQKEAQLAQQDLELERQASQKRSIIISALAFTLALLGLFQFFRNKQKIKQKEAELAVQIEHAEAEKLREMDSMKSTFFANISHEFRTPLTLIVSPLEQMINGSFQGDFQKYYRIMHRNGKRLLDLVNQLLDLSRLESGKLKLQVTEGDLAGFAKAVAYSFESLAVRKQIDYQVVVDDSKHCFFDKDKVEKILSNLVSNAFKFTNDGKRISIASNFKDGNVRIRVSDQGMGIPADQLPHIFERFSKIVTSELQPGSGIGLALTKELVELHKGKIEVESKEGEGTTFIVTLPVSKATFSKEEIVAEVVENEIVKPIHEIETEKTALQNTVGNAFDSLNKPVLLVVEDNADVRNYIVDQFIGQYQIIEAENGRLGLEKALESTPDLIISDIMMPEMDGTEFCKLLKTNEKTSHIPVVMLTALAEQGDRLQGLKLGADDYLVKPFHSKELTVRVANLIAGRQKLQEHYRKSLNSFAPIAEVKAESMDAIFLKKVREMVETNMEDENFSVVELGAQVGMSRSQLHRKLSALTGFSPNEIIRNMRLEKAKQLLEKRVGNASEVAYMTGFNSAAYFTKCFKDYFGVTPSEV